MSELLSRRQWLVRSGTAFAGALLSRYLSACRQESATASSSQPIRMMFNENPYGPSEIARKAMIEAFNEGNLYSRDAYNTLRALIAEQVGLTPEHIAIGSGSREILNVAGLLCGLENGELLAPHPTYEAMINYTQTIGAKVQRVPLNDEMAIDLEAMRKALSPRTKLVYVCNPNNPTGLVLPANRLRPFCEEIAEKALVFVDEAYHEYVENEDYKSMVELVKEGKNVLVSRTASKIHGLAGLRVGFGIGNPELIQKLSARMTGTVNLIGMRAAIASYRDPAFQAFSRQKNRQSREIVYRALEDFRLKYLPSHTNFIFFRTGQPIEQFQASMKSRGFLVGRPFPPFLDWCRLSMAKPEEMQLFTEVLRQYLA